MKIARNNGKIMGKLKVRDLKDIYAGKKGGGWGVKTETLRESTSAYCGRGKSSLLKGERIVSHLRTRCLVWCIE